MRALCPVVPVCIAVSVLLGGSTPAYAQASTPTIFTGGVVSAAGVQKDIAPGAIISIYGQNLSSCTEQTGDPLSAVACGGQTKAYLNGTPIPLFFVSAGQINAQVPYGVSAGMASFVVESNGIQSGVEQKQIKVYAPSVFTVPRYPNYSGGSDLERGGFPAIQRNSDYSLIDFVVPAKPGDVMIAYATGLGPAETVSAGVSFARTPDVYVDGSAIPVISAAKNAFLGQDQVAFTVPQGLATGVHTCEICYDSRTSCSPVVELPVSAGAAYLAGWILDRTLQPLPNTPVSLDGQEIARSTASGAFLAQVTAGASGTVHIDGGTALYHWEDYITAATGANFLRAVSTIREANPSGSVVLIPRMDAASPANPSLGVYWTYDMAAGAAVPGIDDPTFFWTAAGQPTTLLELITWYGDAYLGPCGDSMVSGINNKDTPVPYFIQPGAPDAVNTAIQNGLELFDASQFAQAASDPTAGTRGIRIEVAALGSSLASFTALQADTCGDIFTGIIYLSPSLPASRVAASAAFESRHALGILRRAPPDRNLIMNFGSPATVPHPLELEVDKDWQFLPPGTLLRKFKP